MTDTLYNHTPLEISGGKSERPQVIDFRDEEVHYRNQHVSSRRLFSNTIDRFTRADKQLIVRNCYRRAGRVSTESSVL